MDINLTSQIFVYTDLASFPVMGATKTFYVADDTEKLYRWTGSAYVEVSAGSGSGTWGSITGTLSAQIDLQTALNGKVDENAAITGATKTKITYDAKGLVTGGADATTADIAASTNKNYVTDAQLVVVGNTSNTNTGDETAARIGAIVNGTTDYTTPLDADKIGIWDVANSLFKSVTFANLKATLVTYFNGLYSPRYIVRDTVGGTAITGTLANTLCYSASISANTFETGDIFEIITDLPKTGTAGTSTFRYYFNTSASLSGATLVATYTNGSTSLGNMMNRILGVKSATVTSGVSATISTVNGFVATTGAVLSANINWSVQQYFIVAIQQSNTGDSSNANFVSIIKK
jgi:hypothetical protein